jgi:hypothetical protein
MSVYECDVYIRACELTVYIKACELTVYIRACELTVYIRACELTVYFRACELTVYMYSLIVYRLLRNQTANPLEIIMIIKVVCFQTPVIRLDHSRVVVGVGVMLKVLVAVAPHRSPR